MPGIIMFLLLPPAFAVGNFILDIHTPKPFPKMQFKDEKGSLVNVQDIKSKLSVVHFWATWCAPCIDELPEIARIQERYAAKGLKIITVSMDGEDNGKVVRNFLKENKLESLPVYLDVGTKAFQDSGAKGVPTSFFIDDEGKQIAVAEGMLDWEDSKTTGFLEFNLLKAK